MLTAYDYSTARVFDDAEIPVLLVGDSAANVVYGYDTTVPVTVDELIPLVRGVVRGAPHALVVADMPFGSYEAGPQQALATATRFLKEAGAHAVKLEGGERVADQIATLTQAGIPVVAHIGFTPQSVNGLGGFRVQGRGDAAEQTIHDAIAVQEAGAIAVVLEMVPAELATQITGKLTIPTVGIGAGPNCDAQVLVWQDMAGMTSGKTAKFVKRFGDVGVELRSAATQYANEVASGAFPAEEHSASSPSSLDELGLTLRQEGVDTFTPVGRFRAFGDQAALEFHLLFEPTGKGGEQQRLDSAVGSLCGESHLVGELIGAGGQFRVGNHLGDQSPLRRFLRRQRAVGQHQLLGLGDADEPRQEVRRAAVGAQTRARVGHRERCGLGSEHQVTGHRE